jgi:hypothetical protein
MVEKTDVCSTSGRVVRALFLHPFLPLLIYLRFMLPKHAHTIGGRNWLT